MSDIQPIIAKIMKHCPNHPSRSELIARLEANIKAEITRARVESGEIRRRLHGAINLALFTYADLTAAKNRKAVHMHTARLLKSILRTGTQSRAVRLRAARKLPFLHV